MKLCLNTSNSKYSTVWFNNCKNYSWIQQKVLSIDDYGNCFLTFLKIYNHYIFPLRICRTEKETQMYITDFWTLWEKARVGWSERVALKHVYYQVWNRSPAQVGCMRQVLGPGALGRPRGIGWGGRWEGGSGWGTHVNPWLIHVNVWQNPLKYCKVISLKLI